jgi:hypothetical protein
VQSSDGSVNNTCRAAKLLKGTTGSRVNCANELAEAVTPAYATTSGPFGEIVSLLSVEGGLLYEVGVVLWSVLLMGQV